MRYNLRPIHTRDFAPGACSRGTLREQSSSLCTNDFMGILHPREQNFHPAKCSTIFKSLNVKCTDTCKMSLEHAPGTKLLVCIGVYSTMVNCDCACGVSFILLSAIYFIHF